MYGIGSFEPCILIKGENTSTFYDSKTRAPFAKIEYDMSGRIKKIAARKM